MTAASKTFSAKTDGCAKNAIHVAHGFNINGHLPLGASADSEAS